jgi:hypothetical protein
MPSPGVGSIPTAPTSFLIHVIGLPKTARQQKAAIRRRMRWSVSNSELHGWHTDAYPLAITWPASHELVWATSSGGCRRVCCFILVGRDHLF